MLLVAGGIRSERDPKSGGLFLRHRADPYLTKRPLSPNSMFFGVDKAALARAYLHGSFDCVSGYRVLAKKART
jgi:hypothetical protein